MIKQLKLPQFKYLPNAYQLGLFREESFICDVCKTEQTFLYVGPYYMEKENTKGTSKVTNTERKICAFCIESGKAAEKLNAEFKDTEILEQACYNKEHIDEEKCETVIQTWLYNTPNFIALENETWPICCSNFTAFIGYIGSGEKSTNILNLEYGRDPSEITANLEGKSVDELFRDLDKALEVEAIRIQKTGIDVKNGIKLEQILKKEDSIAIGYLFKCTDCDQYQLHVDFIQKA